MRNLRLIGTLAAVIVLVGCGGEPTSPTSPTSPAGSMPAATSSSSLAPLPGPLVAAGEAALLGRWLPAPEFLATQRPDQAHLEFTAAGRLTGSDGCNDFDSRYESGPDGALVVDFGVMTQVGCDNVPLPEWLHTTRRAGVDGESLVLLDATGDEVTRLQRD
jgi:heat shock protein HslJ